MGTFVGFGFGAIQAGLFLYEAQRSGAFERLVVAEVQQHRVDALRRNGGYFTVNIAHADHIEQAEIGPVEIYNPGESADRTELISALTDASEAATALPSVQFYRVAGPEAVNRIIAAALARKAARNGPPTILYCAENHNAAARLLYLSVAELPSVDVSKLRDRAIRFVDTVIGKMSGVVPANASLASMMPGDSSAFLVEAFNRILVSRDGPTLGDDDAIFIRRLEAFVEKQDLAPFEAAKLYCHNGGHATAGFLGKAAGLAGMDQLAQHPDLLATTRAAMVDEAGAALVYKYAGIDPLFTSAGMIAYADDLLVRMINPHLHDDIDRVTRDPARKLGWDDRLIGAMRLSIDAGISPRALAQGAAAAFAAWTNETGGESSEVDTLRTLWPPTLSQETTETVLRYLRRTGR